MSERLAQLFVELSAKNQTAPVFAHVKKELIGLVTGAQAAKTAINTSLTMPTQAAPMFLAIQRQMGLLVQSALAAKTQINTIFSQPIPAPQFPTTPATATTPQPTVTATAPSPINFVPLGTQSPAQTSAMMAQLAAGVKAQQMNMAALAQSSATAQSNMNFPTLTSPQQVADAFGGMSAKTINNDVETIIANYKRAQATAGMTRTEVKQWDAAQKGAKQSSLDMLNPLIAQEKQQRRLQESAAQLSAAWGNLRINSYVLMYAAAGLSGAIGGFVAAASPAIWQTFTGSIQEASAAIGTGFTPIIIEISQKIQQFADWFLALDEATRHSIGSWATWSIGIFAGTVAVVQVMRVIAGLYSALALLGSGLRAATVAMYAFAAANPVTAILALVAAIGALAVGLSMVGSSANSAVSDLEEMESIIERLASGGSLTRREFERLFTPTERQNLAASNQQQQMEMLRAKERELRQQTDEEAGAEDRARELERRLRDIEGTGGLFGGIGRQTQRNEALQAAGLQPQSRFSWDTTIRQERMGDEAIRGFVAQVRGGFTEAQARLAATRNLIGQGGVPANLLQAGGGPLRTNDRFQSQTMRVEDVWRSIQTAALSTTPHEQYMLRIQEEQREYLRRIANRIAPPGGNQNAPNIQNPPAGPAAF